MKDRYIYPAVLKFEDDSIIVEFPDLEGCITFGESEEYALYNIKEALEGYLCFLEIDDVEIPAESKLKYIGLCGEDATIIMVDVCTRSGSQQISKKDSYNS